MMLGKRSRPPFRRTASMTGITVVDVGSDMDDGRQPPVVVEGQATAVPNGYDHHSMAAMVSPRYFGGGRTTSGDGYRIETPASFLTTCGLCNRRLAPCRDIFMYRGDTAFCSQECREEKMKQDERKERINNMKIGNNGGNHHDSSGVSTVGHPR